MKYKRHLLSTFVVMSVTALLMTGVIANSGLSVLVELDYINWFKGYTVTLSVDPNGLVQYMKSNIAKPKSIMLSKNLKLNKKQLHQLNTMLNNMDIESLEAEYGLNSRATDEPSYRLRIDRSGRWKEVRIEPNKTVPIATKELLALSEFLMRMINSQ